MLLKRSNRFKSGTSGHMDRVVVADWRPPALVGDDYFPRLAAGVCSHGVPVCVYISLDGPSRLPFLVAETSISGDDELRRFQCLSSGSCHLRSHEQVPT